MAVNDDTKKFFEELAGGKIVAETEDEVQEEAVEVTETEEAADISDEREGQLAIDVFQTADAIIIESPIAGVNSEDLDINITNESVSIKGRRDHRTDIKESDYFYQECYWGRFSRSVILPQEIDPDKADAHIKNGVLTIVLPKIKKQKRKKLKVKID